jgi:hypothetical protein
MSTFGYTGWGFPINSRMSNAIIVAGKNAAAWIGV